MRITISGPPGSGKTTACKLLAEKLGFEYVISGNVFREMAQKLGLSLADFGKLCESDPEYDRMIDDSMMTTALTKQDIIVEGRLAGHLLARQDVISFKVLIDAEPRIRASRISEREGEDLDRATEDMLERERSEAVRYMQYYHIDITDKSVYDLIVDSGDKTPEQIVDLIVKGMEEFIRPAC